MENFAEKNYCIKNHMIYNKNNDGSKITVDIGVIINYNGGSVICCRSLRKKREHLVSRGGISKDVKTRNDGGKN